MSTTVELRNVSSHGLLPLPAADRRRLENLLITFRSTYAKVPHFPSNLPCEAASVHEELVEFPTKSDCHPLRNLDR